MFRLTNHLMGLWIAVVAVCTMAVGPVHGQTVHYAGSVQYATGNYIFAERTHSVYVANGIDLSWRRVQASASFPIIYQSSPWVSYSVVGSVPSGGPQHGTVGGSGGGPGGGGPGSGRRRGSDPIVLPDTATYADVGIGDPSLRADLTLRSGLQGGPDIRLAGSVKAPIADVDRGFGTGAWDRGLGLTLSQRIRSWFLFGEAMYWWMGNMDEFALGNSIAYSVSLGRSLRGGRVGLLASLSGYTTAIVEDTAPPLQTAMGISYTAGNRRYGFNASAAFGLTESTPDASFGLGWRVPL
jgi:hypothetical protein